MMYVRLLDSLLWLLSSNYAKESGQANTFVSVTGLCCLPLEILESKTKGGMPTKHL